MEEQVSFEREQNACRKKYLENLVQSRAKVEQDEGNGRKILAGLKERESILFKELQALNDEEAMILRETGVFNKMHQKNEEECIRVFNNLRNLHSDSSIFTVENTKRNGMISSTRDALDVLSTNRNMFPRLFYINFDENNIGSINGLKLARFSGEKKSNAESNAAWGQCIHCLERLFALNDINMAPYYLDLAGAYSTISYTNEAGVVDEMKMYEGISVDFKITDFDKAILHFFNCLRKFETEFCNKVEVPNNRLFPNTIYKDSIAEGFVSDVNDKCVDWYSGKISFNNDKRWAKAMRLMLMNLKVGVLETGI
uniref:APG6 domain-containing protein n=1 Tax=Rhabditophanes sp. KR3021 TaxID=114890 RepID=A0AC35U7L7_9BILA